MTNLRDFAKRLRDWVVRASRNVPSSRLLYGGLSTHFSREFCAVHSGIRRHEALATVSYQPYELRRRLHMIEKGLSMRPRRPIFALDYIRVTLQDLEHALASNALNDETRAWARDVLSLYFEVTSGSDEPDVIESRRIFASLDLESPVAYVGPRAVGPRSDSDGSDFAVVERIARDRKSVRWYEDRRVKSETIIDAVRVAMESPSACNRLPYRFEVLLEPADAREVAGLAGGTKGFADNLQCLVVVVGDLSAYSSERDRHLIYIDSSLATMALVLALEARGLGTLCINWPDLRGPERRIRTLLNHAPYERVIMLVAVGYPDSDGYVPGSARRPVGEVVCFRSLAANGDAWDSSVPC